MEDCREQADFQEQSTSDLKEMTWEWSLSGRMVREIDVQPKAEAKKADGANITTLLVPMPPAEIGKEACFQLKSLSLI